MTPWTPVWLPPANAPNTTRSPWYQRLLAWAHVMNLDEVAALLEDSLKEEKATDEKLSALAEGGINENAFDAATESGNPTPAAMCSCPRAMPCPRPSSRRSGVRRGAGSDIFGGPRGDRTHDHLIKSQMLYH